jgi:gas vesicle protein
MDDEEDRMVIVERDGGSKGLGMLLLGLAVGAGAALLFAPASGEETRERLQRETRRAGRKVRDLTDALAEGVTDGVERGRSAFDTQVGRARDAVSSRKRAVTDALDAGRGAADDTRADLERAVADAKRAYADSRRAYREARFSHARRVAARDGHDHDGHDLPSPPHSADHDGADGTEAQG